MVTDFDKCVRRPGGGDAGGVGDDFAAVEEFDWGEDGVYDGIDDVGGEVGVGLWWG